MDRYEYKFYRIKLTPFFRKPKEDYQEVIGRMTRDGWRLIQIFSPAVSGHGASSYFELIFERQRM
ncbi:DUF4177 domain-containing protein [Prolixibacter denitrificans]|uniref:Uncharacterized protein DUF4177 n=1 Tax=Prolixibacter denitrificans TaxID=1541063 RepID=A0A2P8CHY7_9BACT|nr:DUF4177 domain-containing protein [Prolixibacter denitrificans]PSK84588.1 uncharacterized protein DUF4177 [Prolixibacter denitrificans]GET20755.1 hypothetical protein JCM18694_10010 [Prolixibacter denitrificans]